MDGESMVPSLSWSGNRLSCFASSYPAQNDPIASILVRVTLTNNAGGRGPTPDEAAATTNRVDLLIPTWQYPVVSSARPRVRFFVARCYGLRGKLCKSKLTMCTRTALLQSL